MSVPDAISENHRTYRHLARLRKILSVIFRMAFGFLLTNCGPGYRRTIPET